jgi:hypothetical protein
LHNAKNGEWLDGVELKIWVADDEIRIFYPTRSIFGPTQQVWDIP